MIGATVKTVRSRRNAWWPGSPAMLRLFDLSAAVAFMKDSL
jgi:hypothetical protein